MIIAYIIFILICILLILAIIFGILLYKQIKERLNYYDDVTEFIEFNNSLININKIEWIVKYDNNITIVLDNNLNHVEKFDSEEDCNNRYLDILDCISYYPKSY